jgi:hypothetical protein
MIGVIARPDEHDVVREFFELFKTPWEFCRRDKRYRVLLVADGTPADRTADLVLVYGGEATGFDYACRRLPASLRNKPTLSWDGATIPIYGKAAAFSEPDATREVVLSDTREPVAWAVRMGGKTVVRVGYDLFRSSTISHCCEAGSSERAYRLSRSRRYPRIIGSSCV